MHSFAACTAASDAANLATEVSYWFGLPLSFSHAALYTSICAAWLKDQGKPSQYETSVAKLAASEAAVHAANECMKIYGSYGFSTEFPAERFYRDAKSLQVVEGTSNIQKIIISGMACGHTPNRE